MLVLALGWAVAAVAGPAEDLYQGIEAGDAAKVRGLLEQGADPNSVVLYGTPVLNIAAARGDRSLDVVQALLAKGADVNAKDGNGYTALMQASYGYPRDQNFLGVVQMLLAKGAEVNAQAAAGKTALMHASCNAHLDAVQMLHAKGTKVNAPATNGRTALMEASACGRLDVVQPLVAEGADLNLHDKSGDTALTLATAGSGIVPALLAKGGSPPDYVPYATISAGPTPKIPRHSHTSCNVALDCSER